MRDNFRYSNKVLRIIAENYILLYEDGLCFKDTVIDGFELAEFICDFEVGLSSLGKQFILLSDFKDYREWNIYQRIIISDIYGILDDELWEKYKIQEPERLRQISYSKMKRYLNGVKNE